MFLTRSEEMSFTAQMEKWTSDRIMKSFILTGVRQGIRVQIQVGSFNAGPRLAFLPYSLPFSSKI